METDSAAREGEGKCTRHEKKSGFHFHLSTAPKPINTYRAHAFWLLGQYWSMCVFV